MLFREFGDRKDNTVILLHGGGLSWWSLTPAVKALSRDYRVVTPVIDGHGEDGGTTFISIEDSADKLIQYIDAECGGRVYALGGLSLGGQIAVEVLSRRPAIADYALIESALVTPMRGLITAEWIFNISYGLISRRWFSKLQAKSLFVPAEQYEHYYEDSTKISKTSLSNISRSNASYALKSSIRQTSATTLVIVGEKELGIMRQSAEMLVRAIPKSQLHVAGHMKHGELSLARTDDYLRLITGFLRGDAHPSSQGSGL